MSAHVWLAVGPEVRYSAGWDDPPEYGHDVVYVLAETAREARNAAVPLFRAIGADYLADAENPYTGVTVEDLTCRHGTVASLNAKEEDEFGTCCPACEDEILSEDHARAKANDAGMWEW